MSHGIQFIVRFCRRTVLCLIGIVLLIGVIACGSSSTASNVPTATAAVSAPTPTLGPAIIYQDPLTLPSANWPNDPSTGCSFGSGGYHVKGANFCIIPPENYTNAGGELGNADISVQVKQIGGPPTHLYGIGLRFGTGFLYRFDITSDGKWTFRLCHLANCTVGVGLTANPAIHAGLSAANMLEVRAVASHFDFFVNGTKVGQADDSTSVAGPAALGGADGIEVVFSNLKITSAS
jgi:hypothetical protein